jgi:adenosylcobinamide-GDP ribazoletransferase
METATLADGLRFAFGTLTVLRVHVTRWDAPAARRGMTWAALPGAVVGLAAALAGVALLLLGAPPLLAAVAATAVPAALTRGLHLDGLADVADGLGSGKPPADALRVMKQSDVGPFGVVTLVLVVLGQVAALSGLFARGWAWGAAAAVLAGTVSRAALTLACRAGVPAARPKGLGAAVAGSVPRGGVAAAAVLTLAAAAGVGAALAGGTGAVSRPRRCCPAVRRRVCCAAAVPASAG